METLQIYWLAFKMWLSGVKWSTAYIAAINIIIAGWRKD